MVALGSSSAGAYVIVGAPAAPAATAAVNGSLICTEVLLAMALTNRISLPQQTACPGVSPCALENVTVVPLTEPTGFPAHGSGAPPSAASTSAPCGGGCEA